MHFHLPKPLHGWREFAGEVGIIVVGVLIALGAEQIVETVHHRASAREAKNNVESEIADNLASMASRRAIQGCVAHRLTDVGHYVTAIGRGERAAQPTWVGRPQVWTMATSRWTAASGAEGLLAPDEQSSFSDIYVSLNEFAVQEHDEQLAWAELRALTYLPEITSPEQSDMVKALQVARLTSWRIGLAIEQASADAKALGIRPKANPLPGSISVCLPMNTPFDDGVKRSRTSDIGEPS
jgi:hypothetical protein